MTDETLDRIDAAILAWLASLNTKTTGYIGLAIVVASYLAPVLVPEIDLWIASLGLPTLVVHAFVAMLGGLAALLGRWRTFAPTSDVAADVPRPAPHVAAPLQTNAGTAGGRSPMSVTEPTPAAPKTFVGGLADALVALYEGNEAKLLSLLQAQNIPVTTFVENAALALIAKNPMLNLVLQGEIKGSGPMIIAFFGSEESAAFAAFDAWLHVEAKALGG